MAPPVAAPDAKVDIPADLAERVPQLVWLSALSSVFTRARFRFEGAVVFDEARGPGLSLVLLNPRGQAEASTVIWDRDLRLPGGSVVDEAPKSFDRAHLRLAAAAAAWLAWTSTKGNERRLLDAAAGTSWRSYALFRMGAHAHLSRDLASAARYYRWSLTVDPMNPGANFNLGSMLLAAGPVEGEPERKYLDDAAPLLQRAADCPNRLKEWVDMADNALAYRVGYNRAVLSYEAVPYLTAGNVANNYREAASAALGVTIDAADRIIRTQGWDRRRRLPAELCDLIVTAEQSAALLAAAGLAAARRAEGAIVPVQGTDDALFEVQPDGTVVQRHRRLAEEARRQRDARPRELVGRSLAISDPAGVRVPARVRYNLACYFAESNQLRGAWEELAKVVAEPALAERAGTDPALKTLREDASAWAKLFKTAPALAEIASIGTTHATKLVEAEIPSAKELVAATTTARKRAELASLLSVPVELIGRWRESARIATLPGLKPSSVNLLDDARIDTLMALAEVRDPNALSALLDATNVATHRTDPTPTAADVTAWVQAARKAATWRERTSLLLQGIAT